MSVWRVCERAELGQVGRHWELAKDQPLSVGRSADSHIQVQSKSVEHSHAVLEWSTKMAAYIVRDRGSVNGTYVNNQPVRGGCVALKHGDVVRFGYEKTHIFRIEEKHPSPAHTATKSSSRHSANRTPVSTQTSPRKDETFTCPPSLPRTAPLAAASPTHHMVQVGSPVPPQTVVLPPTYIHQQSPVPLVVPQFGYPGSPPVSLHPTPVSHVTFPHAGSAFHPISPTQFLQLSTPPPPPPTTSTPESPLSVDELESSGSGSFSKPQRSDGRRAVELTNSPNLSKVSKLYGKPSWWGEEKATEKENEQEFEFVKPGSQILRDYDRRERSSSCEDSLAVSGRPQRHSASEELRFKAISKSRECASPASTWVVDFDSNTLPKKKRPSRFDKVEHRPRSADPSPNRAPPIKKDLLPPTANLKRSTSTRSPSSSPRRSPVMTKRPQSLIKKKQEAEAKESAEQTLSRSKTVVKKPPSSSSSGGLARTKTTVKKASPSHTVRARKSSLERSTVAVDVKESNKNSSSNGSAKKNALKNETYVTDALSSSTEESLKSQSDVSLSLSSEGGVTAGRTPNTAALKSSSAAEMKNEEGESNVSNGRPSSARKQWNSEQAQATDGLMLASIEARIRRLSKLAHSSARQLSCLQRSLQDVPGVIVHSIPPTSPLGSQRGADQRLPEWRFNKEGDSIFRSMRTVEKWLKDIQATVNSIQIGSAAAPGDGRGVVNCEGVVDSPRESIDYQAEYEATESEVEAILQDSIDVFYSFSDTEEN